ncbi:MAG: S-layer homology domain-containing protein, partial [Oscillospiraceae bacterium]|nr:S-layer homology domain-containing protein [Oscillospiraceae bacterium]
MKKRLISIVLALIMTLGLLTVPTLAVSDTNNGDWAKKTAVLRNTGEAELMVRVGDIDALNDDNGAVEKGYNPFTAKSSFAHSWPGGWLLDPDDPEGTDRIYIGSHWGGKTADGYAQNFQQYKNGGLQDRAFGEGAMTITMDYDISGITVKNALLQLCIDDFQTPRWGSNFTVKLGGRDAPFIAELLNHVDQTGPISHIVSAIIPSGFFSAVSSGKLVITIDEINGVGDGYAMDFVKLLVNYNEDVFMSELTGTTEPGATVRLLGTSTTVTTGSDGSFTFMAVPGLNVVRASKNGYTEKYESGIVLSSDTVWNPKVALSSGSGNPDIDFSLFAVTDAWSNASEWARPELDKADALSLIPDSLRDEDLTKSMTRAEFCLLAVTLYEKVTGTTITGRVKFTDTTDVNVEKAAFIGVVNGVGNNRFDPNGTLTREQAATMLARLAESVSKPLDKKAATFGDKGSVSTWALEAVGQCEAAEIMGGTGNNQFSPGGAYQRQQSIATITRMYDYLDGKGTPNHAMEVTTTT